MTHAIRTDNLTKKFRHVDALRSLNLELPTGAIYGLVGSNGAGKTTAIKILMNITEPSGGRAEILGVDSRKLAGQAFASIGYVSENQDLPEWMTVANLLGYLRPFYPTWDNDLEKALVAQFDLPLDRKLRHLSRGMRMKAALASSLAYHPKLIVLDEPFTGLDPLVRDELIEGMLERAAEATVLISSHDLAEIESFASHIGYIEQGMLRFSEEMSTLGNRFREIEVTLAEPVPMPAQMPSTWLQPQSSGAVVRFVDSQFDSERTAAEIRRCFGNTAAVSGSPMSLRSIFLALARSGRSGVQS